MYFIIGFSLFCAISSFAHTESDNVFRILHKEHIIQKREVTNEQSTTQPTTTTDSSGDSSTITDNHEYYTSKVISDPEGHYWNELENHTRHHLSNDAHLKYSFVTTSFNFSFYGHWINTFGLTTQGFLYMSTFAHDDLDYSHSRYIAPLMGNFDTIGNSSDILYRDDGNSYVVEWRNVQLNDQPQYGEYSFQVTLFQNGTILFAYKSIPLTNISSTVWPVKVGVADAYYIDQRNPFTGRWTRWIVRYHSIGKNVTILRNNMAIILDPLPTCNKVSNCEQCVTANVGFDCSWCPEVSRCSDGLDWYRQEWLERGCDIHAVNTSGACAASTTKNPTTVTTQSSSTRISTTTVPTMSPSTRISTTTVLTMSPSTRISTTTVPTMSPSTRISTTTVPTISSSTRISTTTLSTMSHSTRSYTTSVSPSTKIVTTTIPTSLKQDSTTGNNIPHNIEAQSATKEKTSTAAIVAIVVIIVVFILIIGAWIIYARTHPTSSSGLWLIENRPSQLKEKITKRFSSINFTKTSETGSHVQMT